METSGFTYITINHLAHSNEPVTSLDSDQWGCDCEQDEKGGYCDPLSCDCVLRQGAPTYVPPTSSDLHMRERRNSSSTYVAGLLNDISFDESAGLYECGDYCACRMRKRPDCWNRVVLSAADMSQHNAAAKVVIKETSGKGQGLYAAVDIPRLCFVIEYGRLIPAG